MSFRTAADATRAQAPRILGPAHFARRTRRLARRSDKRHAVARHLQRPPLYSALCTLGGEGARIRVLTTGLTGDVRATWETQSQTERRARESAEPRRASTLPREAVACYTRATYRGHEACQAGLLV